MHEPGRQRQFHMHHCLGRGGYGEVYRATMVSPGGLSTDVAVKLLRVDVDPGHEAVRRLRDEGRVLARLRHPVILRVFDLALLEGRVGLVTEYVEGQDLAAVVGRIPPRALVEALAMVAEALDVAWNASTEAEHDHPLRLVHRDVKPSNIRLGRHGEVKLLDFGIARSTTEEVDRESKTGTGSTVGSLAYMAPERFTRAPVAPAADVYGLGCALYEGLTGVRVFVDPVPVDMFRLAADPRAYAAHLERALAALPSATDPELADLLRRMLAHAPGQRPTASEVRAALEALAERVPGESLRRWAREREWPKVATVPGFLEGRTITEGTLTHSSSERPALTTQERSSETFRMELHPPVGETTTTPAVRLDQGSRTPWLALVAALLALVAVGGAAAIAFQTPPGLVPVPVPLPVPVQVPAPAPTEPAVPAEIPAPVPVPIAPEPRPRPRPEPAPVVVAPEPEPPAPPATTYGEVRAVPADVTVELRGPLGTFGLGRVPTGRYDLWVDFGTGLTQVRRAVDVSEGQTTSIECKRLTYKCDVGE